MVVWRGTLLECRSAFARLRREGHLSLSREDEVLDLLATLSSCWAEISPSEEICTIAGAFLRRHPLRAADSLQLAAALIWADKVPRGHSFVCLDRRLAEAARQEGFRILPGAE